MAAMAEVLSSASAVIECLLLERQQQVRIAAVHKLISKKSEVKDPSGCLSKSATHP